MMTAIGMGAVVLGIVMLTGGWNFGVEGKVRGLGALLIVSGGLIGIGGNPAKGAPGGLPGMVGAGFVGIIAVVVLFLLKRKKYTVFNREKAQKRAERIGATALDRFFVECVLSETDDFSKAKNAQRAQLLAEKYGLAYPDGIEALYQQGLAGHEAVSRRLDLNRLEAKREEERQEFERLNRYAGFTGKAKRTAMLTDRAKELREKAKGQKEYADMLMRMGQQKEKDWAIWGGAAEGIAGIGAGISTAIDVQVRNAQIRAENEQRRQEALPAYLFMTDSADGNRKNADAIMQEIEGLKMKLIADIPPQELFSKITFTNTDVIVSETGAATVYTVASLDPDYRIFDDVPAVADGTIIAKIYEGDKLCGTAQLVLPLYGVGSGIPLKGICTDCCRPGKTYTAKFVPKTLWAMEA